MSELEKKDNLKFSNEQFQMLNNKLDKLSGIEFNFYVESYINTIDKLFIDPGNLIFFIFVFLYWLNAEIFFFFSRGL